MVHSNQAAVSGVDVTKNELLHMVIGIISPTMWLFPTLQRNALFVPVTISGSANMSSPPTYLTPVAGALALVVSLARLPRQLCITKLSPNLAV